MSTTPISRIILYYGFYFFLLVIAILIDSYNSHLPVMIFFLASLAFAIWSYKTIFLKNYNKFNKELIVIMTIIFFITFSFLGIRNYFPAETAVERVSCNQWD